ncbi:MAG: winged helix DNA-binding domain-containing protein [Blastocatellia bacterium]
MPARILNSRELNRATLSRQMLLDRESLPVPAAIERLAGMQAQLASAPFVGLWTRLKGFKREDLASAIEARKIIKATMMRATLHLCLTEDYLRFRTTLQPVLSGAGEAIAKQRGSDFDRDKLLAQARKFIAEKPRTFAEISDWLAELMPDQDVGALRYTIRTHLPMVQIPISSGWSYPGKPEFTLAESWIGRKISAKDDLQGLARRYLAAFGPASVNDMQTWSGLKLPALKEVFEKLKPELQTYRDEAKRELFDLAVTSLPSQDTPAPIRFLPEFDNLLLSHNKRLRIVADEHRSRVYLPALRVAATILIDGFVAGVWKIEKTKTAATLMIEPFGKLTKKDRAVLVEEGEPLVRFVEPTARSFEIRFAEG